MAKLVRDRSGRLLFTREMKREYTLLMPQMLPVQFGIMRKFLELEGYRVAMLETDHRGIVEEGQKYVHNDTCYPALLVIGQLIDAIRRGGYDPHKVALLITQTGGGCRASNYIHLLRKALEKAGYPFVPVVSVSFGVERNPGFRLTLRILRALLFASLYGDVMCSLAHQVRPYETEPGAADRLLARWQEKILADLDTGRSMDPRGFRETVAEMVREFEAVPVDLSRTPIPVGIVGEIYVKFSPLGNNHLEEFLLHEGCEVVVPGVTDFLLFKVYNRVSDRRLYGGGLLKSLFCRWMMGYMEKYQDAVIDILGRSRFRKPARFSRIRELAGRYLGVGNKMGEGWLLTGEMLELIHSGVPNIVCAQPFGCLPNHIVGKGMIRPLKDDYPDSNIVAIDYDPSATAINQENRIKLMLANARRPRTDTGSGNANPAEAKP